MLKGFSYDYLEPKFRDENVKVSVKDGKQIYSLKEDKPFHIDVIKHLDKFAIFKTFQSNIFEPLYQKHYNSRPYSAYNAMGTL